MSKLIQSYSTSVNKSAEDDPLILALREDYPELTNALCGTKNVEGQCVMPPCTLMLFLNEGRLGWCLSPKTGSKVAFGTVSDPSKGLACVESEIAKGNFEWKQSPRKRS